MSAAPAPEGLLHDAPRARFEPAGARARLRRALPWLVTLTVWAAIADTGIVQHRALAGPVAIVRVALADAIGGDLLADIFATALRVAGGVALGSCFGLPLGFVIGVDRARRERIEPQLDFARAIPPVLIFSLLLLMVGYGELARVLAAAYVALLATSLHVADATGAVEPERLRALRAMGAGKFALVRHLYLFELMPAALLSLRQAVCTGLIVTLVGEMLVGADHGLGTRALDAQISYDAARLYAVIALSGVLGQAAALALLRAERRLCAWRG